MILETGFTWRGVGLYTLVGVPLVLAQYGLTKMFDWPIPDFGLILVVHAAFFRGAHEAGFAALIIGAVADTASGSFFGFFMMLRQITLAASRTLATRIFSESAVFQGMVVTGAVILDAVIGWLILRLLTDTAPALLAYAAQFPWRALSSGIAAVPLALFITALYAMPMFNLGKRGLEA